MSAEGFDPEPFIFSIIYYHFNDGAKIRKIRVTSKGLRKFFFDKTGLCINKSKTAVASEERKLAFMLFRAFQVFEAKPQRPRFLLNEGVYLLVC